ncbi:MAG: hypothetical protein AAGH92_08960 [Planctomycetota bacterium]
MRDDALEQVELKVVTCVPEVTHTMAEFDSVRSAQRFVCLGKRSAVKTRRQAAEESESFTPTTHLPLGHKLVASVAVMDVNASIQIWKYITDHRPERPCSLLLRFQLNVMLQGSKCKTNIASGGLQNNPSVIHSWILVLFCIWSNGTKPALQRLQNNPQRLVPDTPVCGSATAAGVGERHAEVYRFTYYCQRGKLPPDS